MFVHHVSGALGWLLCGLAWIGSVAGAEERFDGRFFAGRGDVEYLRLLETAMRMFEPDPELQNLPMLYMPAWNGLVEGPTWGAWWIQNSYGTTYCALPFLQEPMTTFLQNSHDLWFDQMGDGKTVRPFREFQWVPPDGCLCDAASPGWFVAKQGDGRVDIHDWAIEFTAAGLLMQAELLLISRESEAIAHYLPKLRRCAAFVESRRDPKNNLFLAGPAGNLLAPSYAGWRRPDGTYDKAYLAGLSVTYIAALDRLIDLEKLGGLPERARQYAEWRDLARKGLPLLATDEGYLIKSLDPDGTRHGVYGAAKHGYFEASPNHDAIAFRVVADAQAERIYAKIASIPGLRPHAFIIANCPSLDDMYEPPTSWLWSFGTWVNGGHWSTCEGRMVMAYYRLGKHEDVRRSMQHLLTFARRWRMDNPLVKFGSDVYQPNEPINLCYDTFAPAAAMIRGLFEYLYQAEGLTILPHVPPGIARLEQRFPIRLGTKRLYFASTGHGDITQVRVNDRPWDSFDKRSVSLPYGKLPDVATIEIVLGGAQAEGCPKPPARSPVAAPSERDWRLVPPPDRIGTNELPLRIGADSNGENRFVGDIGRVRVYRRALTAPEVDSLYRDRAADGPRQGIVGDWAFDERTEDGLFVSRVPDPLMARAIGEVEVVDAPGGKAIRLTGRGYLEVRHGARLNLRNAVTLEAWIRPKALPAGGGRIIDKSKAGTSDGYLLDTAPGNSLRFIIEAGTLGHDAKLPPDQWAHVAATVDPAGRQVLYVNGKPVAEQTPPATPPLRELAARAHVFHQRMVEAGYGDRYEAQHARLAVEVANLIPERRRLLEAGRIFTLPDRSQAAADRCYIDTAAKLLKGLADTLAKYAKSKDAYRNHIHRLWEDSERRP